MARYTLLALTFLLACSDILTQTKTLRLRPTGESISLDGVIEAAWSQADSADDFFQLQPYYGQLPSRRTVAKVLTSSDALYCLMVCYDDRQRIIRNTGLLDQSGGDFVSIMLDTFDDKQTAYKIGVTASGGRVDCRLLDDARNRDYSWDGVWFSGTEIYDWGYVVEMKIPYMSLKYNPELAGWGIDFDRWVATGSEDLYWCTCEQSEGLRVSKFGRLLFDGAKPTSQGMDLELYPVALTQTSYEGGKYRTEVEFGGDVFYNPSEKLAFQFTANPDFAQIEADPYEFNITRYESYFQERRPFFTAGNEIFMASGKERESGFYNPLELLYSRRIGKALPDGSTVPILFGSKAVGRIKEWEYGGFVARTGAHAYTIDGETESEEGAYFGSARVKKQILGNSSVGVLWAGKFTPTGTYGVLDIDGAFRTSSLQIAYQIARSIENRGGDFAGSLGLRSFTKTWAGLARIRAIGNGFDINQVGFVPWKGTAEVTALTGPVWFLEEGPISQILLMGGFSTNYEEADLYTDRAAVLVANLQFRSNWGTEVDLVVGRNRDAGSQYPYYGVTWSTWLGMSPRWHGNITLVTERIYNFARGFIAPYYSSQFEFDWKALDILELGASGGFFLETRPAGSLEEVTYNGRPFFSLTPINDLNFRVYVDNIWLRSTGQLERVVTGLLVSYNFLPKSWIYLAINDVESRRSGTDEMGDPLPRAMHVDGRAGVFKVRYLYYF
jgi:hypothetical protein